MIKVGLLGLGTVGSGVYEILRDKKESLKKATGKNIEISKILVRDKSKDRGLGEDKSILTENVDDILDDPSIDIIVEVLGGIDLPLEYIKKAIKSGKHVVTANKAVISPYMEELHKLADENNVGLLYEASVAGGVPVIKGLKDIIKINKVSNIKGILNGTTNFIFSKMYDEDLSFDSALALAHEYGFAEADPTDDIEGFDAARKISILASIGFGTHIGFGDVSCRGITSVSSSDIKNFKKLGLVPKLVGSATISGNESSASVEPILVDGAAPFASVSDAFNIVSVEGDIVDELQFYGKGAGKNPTANAVVTDILDIVLENYKEFEFVNDTSIKCSGSKLFKGKYYLRVSSENNDKILSDVKESGVEYEVIDSGDELVILTEELGSEKMESILSKLNLDEGSFCYLRVEA